jgi:23S rRNA (uracil1939-C5)-methyltransferase
MSEAFTLRIDKAIYGGAGLGRHEGKAVFTPLTLPGELVTVSVAKSKASFAEALLDTILEPAPTRTTPPCPYFGTCGGCHYQHATYAAQRAMKAAILEETLTRARLAPLPDILTHASQPLGYRNRIRLHVDPITSGIGYRERASHRILPVDLCPIAAPELQQGLRHLASTFSTHEIARICSQLEISINHDGSELLLALWLRAPAPARYLQSLLASLCARLKPLLPALRGAGIEAPPADGHPSRNKRPRREESDPTLLDDGPGSNAGTLARWGEPRMTYKVGDHDYQVSLGAFFQVNRTLIPELARLATAGRSGTTAWDLYAGVGLFSSILARHFEQVVAVEGSPVSSADLRQNLPQNGAHQPVRSSTLDFLRRHSARKHQSPDFVLVDPPRSGLGEEAAELLSQIRPAHITYVSCDPATLARDLRPLVDSGYQILQLHFVDLFPQTFHLETIVMLSRG